MEEIVNLINQAQISGTAEEAIQNLSAAFELIFRFKDTNGEPDMNNNNNNNNNKTEIDKKEIEGERNFELLENFFENLMEFEFSRFLQVKKFVIEMIGEICSLKPKYLLETLPILSRFMDETGHPILVKSSIICINNLLKYLLFFLNSDSSEETLTTQTIFNDFNQIKEKLISKLDHTETISGPILHQIFRFLESVVLAYSFPNSQPLEIQNPPFNLYYVWKENQNFPEKNHLLQVSDLQNEAENTFKVLVLQLGKQITSSTLVVLINILGQIGKERHTFLKLVLPTLKQIQQETLKTFTGSHISSIQHAIKSDLILFMKSKAPTEFISEILNIFESLGFGDIGTKLKYKFYPHMKRSLTEPSDPRALAKKFKEERDEPEQPISSNISEAGQNLINLLLAAQFTPTMISDLILENMKALPPAPPSNLVIALNTEVSTNLLSLLQIMSEQIQQSSSTSSLIFDPSIHSFTPEQAFEEKNASFIRILESEKELLVEGKNALRVKILSQLATYYDLSDPICNQLFSHILQNFTDRKELALSWIESEYKASKEYDPFNNTLEEGNYESLTRYNSILLKFLKNLKAILEPNDTLLTFLLMHAPVLTKEAFIEIEAYVNDQPFTKMGLSTLRDIVFNRPQSSKTALELLLKFTTSREEYIRAAATRLVSNKLYQVENFEDLTQKIENYATRLFENTQDFDDSYDQDEYGRNLLLYFVLCTKKTSLINKILETFAQTQNPYLKKAILTQSVALVRTVGQTSEICELISNFPKKSEPLVLNFLHILTDKQNPTKELVSVVKNIYHKRVEDPRFLISIIPALEKDEIIKYLPQLVSLPSNIIKTIISKLLNRSSLSPSELMIEFHLLEKDGIPLKTIIDILQICFDEKEIFKPDVLAIVLKKLLEKKQLPSLFMRSVMMTITRYKGLIDFVMDILSQLLGKGIWNDPKLWEGFVKCCKLTLPQSLPVLAQVPPEHQESIWKLSPDLQEAFKQYQQQ